MFRNVLTSASLSLVFGLGLVACGSNSESVGTADQQLVTDSLDATAAVESSTSLGDVVFMSALSSEPATAASDLAAAPDPTGEGCITRVRDASDPLLVHVTFHDCSRLHGLVHLNGEMLVKFSKGAVGELHVEKTGVSLTANGHPLTHTVSADVTITGELRQIAWQGAWSFVNDAGKTVSHTSDLSILVDRATQCRTKNGTAVTTLGARELTSTFDNLKRCDLPGDVEECPTGKVTHVHKLSGKEVTVTFDGSDVAVADVGGKIVDRTLSCTPAAK